MTDNEIIKALECCARPIHCGDCPYMGHNPCRGELITDTFNLVNRQKAEIERLTTLAELGNIRANGYRAMRDKAKNARAEAIKEFAAKLHEKLYGFPTVYNASFWRMIDNLVKEMTEEE